MIKFHQVATAAGFIDQNRHAHASVEYICIDSTPLEV